MYTCSLPGCKSAWGDSDSMVNHLCGNKLKHNKNYIIYHQKDPRGASLTKNEVMDLSEELDNQGIYLICLLNILYDDHWSADYTEGSVRLATGLG